MEPILDECEARVLGVLLEKQLSTPDYYPMTLNALTTACNQKTNRDPVTDYAEAAVAAALDGLQRKRLAGVASGASMRTTKYRHAAAEQLGLEAPALAVLAELLLRGPQTPGELRARAERMHPLAGLDEVQALLDTLAAQTPPLVALVPRQPGQKEARYAQTLAPSALPPEAPAGAASGLEARLAALEEALADLQARFDAFRSQFE